MKLTLIDQDEIGKLTILVERIARPGALVLQFIDEVVTVNGVATDQEDATVQFWCDVADLLVVGPIRKPGDSVNAKL
jgi:hypothetical protein